MSRYRYAALALVAAMPALCAFLGWPVDKVLVTATFGETRADHFHNGVDLGVGGQQVKPVKDGMLVYYFDEAEHPFYQTLGNGNLAVVQHAPGERSYYYHLKQGSLLKDKAQVTTADRIGTSGNTGRSIGAHLHVSYETNSELVNPLVYLPKAEDGKGPTIAAILFLVEERLLTIPAKYSVTGVDGFEFMVRAHDTTEKAQRLAILGIHKISFYIDGRQVKSLVFDRFKERDGRLVTSSGERFDEVYYRDGLYRGGAYRNIVGLHRFRVEATDFAGNSTSKEVDVQFR